MMKDFSFLNESVIKAAPRLLGCLLERKINDKKLVVRIVETEAYDQTDVASHSYRGQTERTAVMFGPSGHLYVYFTYGMHYCCNIVVGEKGYGAAVLIRAVEIIKGEELMKAKRQVKDKINLTNGPAKLCQALSIDKNLNGHALAKEPLRLIVKPTMSNKSIVVTPRIGISKGKEALWRFYIDKNPYISRSDHAGDIATS